MIVKNRKLEFLRLEAKEKKKKVGGRFLKCLNSMACMLQ